MFERFSKHGHQVIDYALDEAHGLRHDYVGTEHILLGLLRAEEGLAAQILESFDIILDEARAQVARVIGLGDKATTGRQIPFSPRATKVLELSVREALTLGDLHVGTEHILLALARESEGAAVRVLLDFGADCDTIRNAIMGKLVEGRSVSVRAHGSTGWTEGWEYRVETLPPSAIDARRLAEFGRERWELVSALPGGDIVRLVFKRPVRPPATGAPAAAG